MSADFPEWHELSEHDPNVIIDLLVKMLVEEVRNPPPECPICLRTDCPSLKGTDECPAKRPLRWLPSDQRLGRARGNGIAIQIETLARTRRMRDNASLSEIMLA